MIAWTLVTAALAADVDWPDLADVSWKKGPSGRADHALVIGIEDYMLVDDVSGAVSTARDWQRWLIQGRGIPLDQVKLLVDKAATRENIEDEARRIAKAARSGSTVWVVYIGHGAPADGGRDGLLVGMDADQTARSLASRGVRRTELERWVGGNQSETVMIVDACFSGKDGDGERLVSDLQPVLATSLASTAGVTLLTAGTGKEFAGPLPGLKRPAFSYLVLGAISGWGDKDGDGVVTALEAVSYARGALGVLLTDRTQTPQVLGSTSRELGRGRAEGPDLFALQGAVLQGPSGGAVSGGGGFGDVSLDVSEKLADQACAAAAERAASNWVEQQLGEASVALKREAEAAWEALAPQAKACLALPLADRGQCIAAVGTWLERADGAEVSVSAGVHQASTDCGLREAAFASRSRAVAIPILAAAKSLQADLRRERAAPVGGGEPGAVTSVMGVELVFVPGGTFTMGSTTGGSDERPTHQVTIDALYVMKTEVTQGLWRAVMGSNPSHFTTCGDRCPVEKVTWEDSVDFANALSLKDGLTPAYSVEGKKVTWDRAASGYRLLTEAEWEYAARGGQSFQYAGSDELGDVGWFIENAGRTTHAACGKAVNGFGLCDMSGNVWEWVWDWHGVYYWRGAQSNPSGAQSGSFRVDRGGSWDYSPAHARVAGRSRSAPGYRYDDLGVRLARPAP